MITKYYKLDMTPFASRLEIPLNQYDDDFEIQLDLFTSENGEFVIQPGTTATIEGKKADGNYYSADAELDGTVVKVKGDKQLTAAAGTSVFKVLLTNEGDLHSATFTIRVDRAVKAGSDTSSDSPLPETDTPITSDRIREIVEGQYTEVFG